tara:strand:- start:252 stop:638 length:387 start_codon:yes stop_codon:yes gene_type:complete
MNREIVGNIKLGRLCVDFDETIVIRGKGLSISAVVPYCKEALHLLSEKGYEVIIASCRTNKRFGGKNGKSHIEMVEFLKDQKIAHDSVDDGTVGKVIASIYIDDKGLGCPKKDGYVDWLEVYKIITGE